MACIVEFAVHGAHVLCLYVIKIKLSSLGHQLCNNYLTERLRNITQQAWALVQFQGGDSSESVAGLSGVMFTGLVAFSKQPGE